MGASVQAPLPIDEFIETILTQVRSQRRAVIVAPPGSGKTTRVPPALTLLGKTILLQPRRVAARTLARRIAFEQNWTIGREVGWQIRHERRFDATTRLLVATEGILTARLQSDPLLSEFSVVILDEFHERSIHADLALALAREAARTRDDLALVVMSATIDPAPIARFLGAPVIEVETRTFPVEVEYKPDLSMAQAVRLALRASPVTGSGMEPMKRGHVLCFLPGAREIERVQRELSDVAGVIPLHGSLSVEMQERALALSPQRKVILATNVAETSLTIEGVTDVIDSGLQKSIRFDPETAIDHLQLEQISHDSAGQRAGRAGRTGPGRVTRLWDERKILRSEREPEVQRVDLTSALLDIFAWGGNPATFEWFERPPEPRISGGIHLLTRLGAIERAGADARVSAEEQRHRITPLGALLARFPLHPRLARVLVAAAGAVAAARVCALLSDDSRLRGTGDALALGDSPHLDFPAGELTRIASRILASAHRPDASEDSVRRALLAGFPDRVAIRREPGSPRLLLASGTGAVLARECTVRGGEFLLVLDVTGGQEALVRIAVPIERDWLTPTHTDVTHALAGDRVRATRRTWYDAILLGATDVAPDPDELRRMTERHLRSQIPPHLLHRIAFAGIEVDWDSIIASTGNVDLPWNVRQQLDRIAPPTLALPSGRSVTLEYREDGSVFAAAKLQELFGLAETPRLGPHGTPVTFSLLAPNGRAVQITRDLRSFWSTTYHDVRKELRGRYPKHPWPDDPWSAIPTHRTKRR
jgi:ATP-dependent helicase HrpB